MAEEQEEDGYRWESGYEKTWEVIEEDEAGLLDGSVASQVARAKRARLRRPRAAVRLGIMRHLYLVLDCSEAMFVQDLKPTRLMCAVSLLQNFVQEFFDQNPISQLGVIVTRGKRAEVVCELTGSAPRLQQQLRLLSAAPCVGEPSLQNALELAADGLAAMPAHTSREVLVLLASLTTCDPGDIGETVARCRRERVRCSVVGLAAELRIARHLARSTLGEYAVSLDDTHLRHLLQGHVPPPPAVAEQDASLIRIGFPSHNQTEEGGAGRLSHCVCHPDRPPDRAGFLCPQCGSKVCELPADCAGCGLTLMSAPHLSRSYHHLFPLPSYIEQQMEEGQQQRCSGCRLPMAPQTPASLCPACGTTYCLDCDLFIHETLHVCPGCSLAGRPAGNNNNSS